MKAKNTTLGILAHVDAGKTTLSESILYLTGSIRRQGRVDHRDTFLDTDEMERTRGITIYSKQAVFRYEDRLFTLLDTPGHADFSPETERALRVLDVAVLVISAPEIEREQASLGGQVTTLWKLLGSYEVPTILFLNKMDQTTASPSQLLASLQRRFGSALTDFSASPADPALQEAVALASEDETLLEHYLAGRSIPEETIRSLIAQRRIFPVYFGSALKNEGTEDLLRALTRWTEAPTYPDAFGGRVFKISRDPSGGRLTWVKLTGGRIRPKEIVSSAAPLADGSADAAPPEVPAPQKVEQIRRYSGERFDLLEEAVAGDVVAFTGLSGYAIGQGMGADASEQQPFLSPVLQCAVILPPEVDTVKASADLRLLCEEEPLLDTDYHEETREILIRTMGRVQQEILRHTIYERFGYEISFGPASVIYRETIAAPVEGVGHFEPLRHYAEVHLLLEPLPAGSGLVFETRCSVDVLKTNWQRLILTHLEERRHKGVLTGSDLTDVRITVIGGRAHEKHTEGGDFRQATYRAVRQGLMEAQSILLEPVLRFRIELPPEHLGRAMTDLQAMSGSCEIENAGFLPDGSPALSAVLTGKVPASECADYAATLSAFTGGRGSFTTSLAGYEPCHNAEEVIAATGYDPEADLRHPSSSVFCSHGVGTIVPWDQVKNYMHVETGYDFEEEGISAGEAYERAYEQAQAFRAASLAKAQEPASYEEREAARRMTDKELEQIFTRTYGEVRPRYDAEAEARRVQAKENEPKPKYRKPKPTAERAYLLVDGYNVLYAHPELRSLAERDLKAARDRLMDLLSNYQGFCRETIILVFDAYRVKGGQEHMETWHNLKVVFTKEAETADQYIEKAAHDMSRHYRVTVATSDAVEQVIIFGTALRMSAAELWETIAAAEDDLRRTYLSD